MRLILETWRKYIVAMWQSRASICNDPCVQRWCITIYFVVCTEYMLLVIMITQLMTKRDFLTKCYTYNLIECIISFHYYSLLASLLNMRKGNRWNIWFVTCCVAQIVMSTYPQYMITSSNGSIFHVIGPLCGEFTGHWWIPLTKASDAKLWCFLWFMHE